MDEGNFMIEFVIILALVILNGVFAMSELAIVSARKIRLQRQAEDGDEGARQALHLAEHPTRFLSTIQIGITLIGTLAGAFGGARLSGEIALWIARLPLPFFQNNAMSIALALVVIVIAYLTLVLGELAPKRLAIANPEAVARRVAAPMALLSRLASPAVGLLTVSTEVVLRLLGVKVSKEPPVTPDEITLMMEQGEALGVFEETETDIVEAVFRLGDLRAEALMTPRTEIEWLDINDRFEDNLRFILDSPHTYFPVSEDDLDNTLGILRAKDLLARLADGQRPELADLLLPVQFIPETIMAFQVLELLRTTSGNLVLVIDEFGGLVGIVTLFDVMKAMVGGISESGEPLEPEAVQRDDGSWLVEGMMRIDEFKDLLSINSLPGEDRTGYQTVGGFFMAQVGTVPRAGDSFECCDWQFEVVDMDGMRVDKVLVSKVQLP